MGEVPVDEKRGVAFGLHKPPAASLAVDLVDDSCFYVTAPMPRPYVQPLYSYILLGVYISLQPQSEQAEPIQV